MDYSKIRVGKTQNANNFTISHFLHIYSSVSFFLVEAGTIFVFLVIASICVASKVDLRWGLPIIAALAGVATGFKIHAPLYFLPVGLTLLYVNLRRLTLAQFCIYVGAGFGSFCFFTLSPFLLPNTDLSNYITYLNMVATHGIQIPNTLNNLALASGLIGISLAPYFLEPSWPKGFVRVWALVFIVVTLVAAVIGGKAGAGANHLYPLIPSSIALLVFGFKSAKKSGNNMSNYSMEVVVLSAVYSTFLAFSTAFVVFYYQAFVKPNYTQEIKNLASIVSSYPNAELAPGGDLRAYFAKPLQVAANGQLTIDAGGYMEWDHVGIGVSSLRKSFRSCKKKYWVFGGESPWAQINYYTLNPVYSEDFVREFKENYEMLSRRGAYTVWGCSQEVYAPRDR